MARRVRAHDIKRRRSANGLSNAGRGRHRSSGEKPGAANQAGVISPRIPTRRTPANKHSDRHARIGDGKSTQYFYNCVLWSYRALGFAARCSHSSLQTLWTLPPLDVASGGDTAHRITGCPLCHLHFPLPPTSRPPFFHRAALRTAAPRGRAPSGTRMWSAGRPDGELGVH